MKEFVGSVQGGVQDASDEVLLAAYKILDVLVDVAPTDLVEMLDQFPDRFTEGAAACCLLPAAACCCVLLPACVSSSPTPAHARPRGQASRRGCPTSTPRRATRASWRPTCSAMCWLSSFASTPCRVRAALAAAAALAGPCSAWRCPRSGAPVHEVLQVLPGHPQDQVDRPAPRGDQGQQARLSPLSARALGSEPTLYFTSWCTCAGAVASPRAGSRCSRSSRRDRRSTAAHASTPARRCTRHMPHAPHAAP